MVELGSIPGRLGCGEFTVENGGRPVRDVALGVLIRAGWVTEEGKRQLSQADRRVAGISRIYMQYLGHEL
jgi:hypothetical protein